MENSRTRNNSPPVRMYCLPDERAQLQANAAAARMSVSSYNLHVGLGYGVRGAQDHRYAAELIKFGVGIPSARMPIRNGPFKNHLIEPGQDRLSRILERSAMLGTPEKHKNDRGAALAEIGDRRGMVSFFHMIPGLIEGGHIDVISPQFQRPNHTRDRRCGTDCHWSSSEV